MVQRDKQDAAQLDLLPEDGVVLDSTGLDFGQVVEKLVAMARERMENEGEGNG